MKSNYALYMEEREGANILEDEKGFATYKILPEGMYIQDIFVKQEFRKEGIAKAYADRIAFEAKLKGITKLIGSVDPRARTAKQSKEVLEAYGMKPFAKDPSGLVYFIKEII